MSNFVDFSSWPREQEQSFVVFEQRAQESSTKAWIFGSISGAVVFVLMVGIYLGVAPEIKDLTKDMNMSNLSKKKVVAPKAEEQPPAEAPKPAETAPPAEAAPATETAPAE